MLRHEDSQSGENDAAATMRVTAEELARAVAALEARQQEEAKHIGSTIPIGQAVQELGLDATPADVWAEVQAQRRAAAPVEPETETAIPPPVTPPLPQTLAAAMRDAAAAATPGLKSAAQAASPALKRGAQAVTKRLEAKHLGFAGLKPAGLGNRKPRGTAFAVLGIATGLAFTIASLSHHATITVSDTPVSMTRTLATVPDEQSVYCDTATLKQIAQSKTPGKIIVYSDGVGVPNGWELVKHDGKVYVRGYTLPLPDQTLQAAPVKIYNDNNAGVLHGVSDQSVTLPLDSLTVDGISGPADWSEIDASKVHADSHLHEDW